MDSPTNGELAVKLDGMMATLIEIKSDVRKTNGRVTALERNKYLAIGAFIMIDILILPLVIQYLGKFIH